MDIAVFALAAQASRLGGKRAITAPRRIFFVVDRRVIVDQAYERARSLSRKLRDAPGGVVKNVADNLRHIARGETTGYEGELPLAAYALRGGMYRSEAWARDPLQPIVVASTVDQVGSRLLFRAYGRASGTWPIYAGLVATDSLILLDEAHCAQPFMQTLQAVRKFNGWAHSPLGRSFQPVVMSATPPPHVQDVFRDESTEPNDPDHTLGKRLLACKPATLKLIGKASGQQETSELSKALAKEAFELISIERRAIAVFVNRVAAARETHQRLLEEYGGDVDTVLLTGRMRPLDKEFVISRHLEILHSDEAETRKLDKPKIVVATQTLEVGADLDFDGLVTECASLDALRQRFGRLNRTGRSIEARAVVLIRRYQAKLTKNDPGDPVYGKALARTWNWLNKIKNRKGEVDFGVSQLDKCLPEADSIGELNAPFVDAPVMLPAHVDCWAQTAPQPTPSPDVAPFLHGPRESAPDVQVCWRSDLDLSNVTGRKYALESLSLCPPSSPETLPVPIGAFKSWLSGSEDDSGDVEGVERFDEQDDFTNLDEYRNVVRWRGAIDTGESHITSDPAKIRPGDVVVVPASHPSDHNHIGNFAQYHGMATRNLDIGDRAHLFARAKPILRLHSNTIDAWPQEAGKAKKLARDLLDDIKLGNHEEEPDYVSESLIAILKEIPSDLQEPWCWLSDAARWLAREAVSQIYLVGGDLLVIAGRSRMPEYARDADTFSDEDDPSSSSIAHKNGQPIKLRNHLRGVERFARRYALGCGIPEDLSNAVARAGLLHDLGKADPRFQALLRGGNPWVFGERLAKSGQMPSRQAYEKAREASGYPKGGRHELLSVRLAESSDRLLPEDENLRDLVLHLIASHHGHCRPFAPVIEDEDAPSSCLGLHGHRMRWRGPTNLERLDSGVAARYWRLTRRYGWWGLAWLETLVRLADWRRSEWEEVNDESE